MEGGQVGEFLPQDKKEWVEIVDKFGQKVPPGDVGRVQPGQAHGVVHGLALPVVDAGQPVPGNRGQIIITSRAEARKGPLSNFILFYAHVGPWDMLNNFCFHV